jgi:hypothetical protein
MMAKRLSDTAAIARKPLKGGNSACPDAGRAITARCAIPGQLQYSYGGDSGDIEYRAEPGVGPQGLRSAVMVLNGGRTGK